jgi:HD-GYP domain-containing protein (c-di-GMP phosphodiesterase class II)
MKKVPKGKSDFLSANDLVLPADQSKQLTEAMRNLERAYDITVEAFGDALAARGAVTPGHSERVAAFSIGIARAMGLPSEQIRVIARGAFLHDLGKLSVPDIILHKPDRLTPDEIAVIRQFPYRGYQMIKKVPFLAGAAEIVYSHRERFDGTGYPRGLKGEEIPLGARIVSVTSTLDAITSNRPHRAAQSLQYAREEIERWWGRQFDPEVVKVFLEMPEGIWGDLRKEIGAQT